MLDTADRSSIRKVEKSAARLERDRGEQVIEIAGSARGRAYLWAQLAQAHLFSTPYSPDTNQTYFNLGEQNAGLRLLSDIMQWCPEQFIAMMREANAARSTESNASASTKPDPDESDASSGAAGEQSRSSESGRVDQGPGGDSAESYPDT